MAVSGPAIETGFGLRVQRQMTDKVVREVTSKTANPVRKTNQAITQKALRVDPPSVPGTSPGGHLGKNVDVMA